MNLDRHDNSWKNIYRNRSNVPEEEDWKWDYGTWVSLLEAIMAGEEPENLDCPICGQPYVYFRFLAARQSKADGMYHGARWIGCENCEVQVHDRGIPPFTWTHEPEWEPAAERYEERRRRELEEYGLE